MFTWVTHDKTRKARCQEQTGANLISGIRVCIMPKKFGGGAGGYHLKVEPVKLALCWSPGNRFWLTTMQDLKWESE